MIGSSIPPYVSALSSLVQESRAGRIAPMDEVLHRKRREVLADVARHGGRTPRVFGSVARGQATATSDVDLLVDMEPGRTLLDLIGLEQELAELLGRAVDVVTDGGLSPHLRGRILAEAVAL